MPTRVISYDFDDDHFAEHTKRYKRLRKWEFSTLQEAIEARQEYLEEIASKLRVDQVLFVREDGAGEMVTVQGSEGEDTVEEADEKLLAELMDMSVDSDDVADTVIAYPVAFGRDRTVTIHVCPKDPTHKTFLTTAAVGQEWEVDEDGEFIEVTDDCLQVIAGADDLNQWNCAVCGEYAEIKEVTVSDDDE